MAEKGSVFTDLGDELSITKEDEYFRYEYDLLNRLERVYSLDEVTEEEVFVKSYVYNASGIRIFAEDAEGIKTHYTFDLDAKVVEKETDDTIRNFFYLGSKVVAHKEANGTTIETLYYGTDHLGISVLMTDATGASVWIGAVTPFADQESIEGLAEHVMFTGKEMDTDTGLYYYNARWYDPNLGRFITEDPVREGLNWFIYVVNNPLKFIDPTGLLRFEYDKNLGIDKAVIEEGDTEENINFDELYEQGYDLGSISPDSDNKWKNEWLGKLEDWGEGLAENDVNPFGKTSERLKKAEWERKSSSRMKVNLQAIMYRY